MKINIENIPHESFDYLFTKKVSCNQTYNGWLRQAYNVPLNEKSLRMIYHYSRGMLDKIINNPNEPPKAYLLAMCIDIQEKPEWKPKCIYKNKKEFCEDSSGDKIYNQFHIDKINKILSEEQIKCPIYLIKEYTTKKITNLSDEEAEKILDNIINDMREQLICVAKAVSFFAPRQKDIEVYRGFNVPQNKEIDMQKKFKGFLSCSYDPKVAINFAKKKSSKISIVMIITIPPNVDVFLADYFSSYDESEIVVVGDLKFNYSDAFMSQDVVFVKCTVQNV